MANYFLVTQDRKFVKALLGSDDKFYDDITNDVLENPRYVMMDPPDKPALSTILHFARDEGPVSAMQRLEKWRDAIEDMREGSVGGMTEAWNQICEMITVLSKILGYKNRL